jgi:hypothetical protein
VVRHHEAAPEIRAAAASALLARGHEAEAEHALALLPAPERGPLVAYLLHGNLPDLLAADFPRGRRALMVVRAFGTADSVARSDRLLLQAVIRELGRERSPRHRRWLGPLVQAVGPGQPSLLVDLMELPGAPHDVVMGLLAKRPELQAEARDRMVGRMAGESMADEALWRALARWGPREPLMARLQARGAHSLAAARALAFAPPDPTLALAALEVGRDRAADPGLRRAALTVVERVGSASLASALVATIGRENDPSVGYRTDITAIMLAGESVAVPALEAFPRQLEHRDDQLRATLVGATLWLGGDAARRVALRAVRSRASLARLTGVLLLERVGASEDAARLRHLSRDGRRVRGLPAGDRIGTQAARVMALLKQRGDESDAGRDGHVSMTAGWSRPILRESTGGVGAPGVADGDDHHSGRG